MMGYTHAIIGASGALAYAVSYGDSTPELYTVAVVAGTLGGVIVDIDTRDHTTNPKVTDASRSRFAAIGLLLLGVIIGLVTQAKPLMDSFLEISTLIVGSVLFVIICTIGFFSPHRTFSHSLLFVIASTVSISLICINTLEYYMIGSLLHILLDMLNNPFQHHGIWLFYPIKIGKGIALGWCKAARKGNKVFYFIGLFSFLVLSCIYIWQMQDMVKAIVPGIVMVYMVLVMHFVRIKSEREQRHIMYISGEL
jgi:inner membrane protein